MEHAEKITNNCERENRASPGAPLAILTRHEWRRMSRDKTLWTVGALLALLMIYAASSGAAWIDSQKQIINRATTEENERLGSMREELRLIDAGQEKAKLFRDPARPGWVGEFLGVRYAVLPPAALAPLSIGQRDLYPYYFRVSTLSADNFINEDEIENPFNLLTGRFDAAFVIVYLFPLMILAVSYNLLSAEKESGTLALALSQPLGLPRLIAGKILARATLVIALAVSLSIVCAGLSGARLTDGEIVFRLALWSLAVILYGLFWFAVAALVNAFGKSSATNALILAAAWLALTILVPAFLTVFVEAVYPVESRFAFINAAREKRAGATVQINDVLEEFYAANPELRPAEIDKNDYMPGFYAAQRLRDQRLLPLLRSYDEKLERQNNLAENLRFVSPPLAMQSALNDLAATGFYRYHSFINQVHEFHRRWQDFFLPRMFKRERLTAQDYDRFPKFEFADEALIDVLKRILFGFGAIFTPTLIVGFWTFRRLKIYPVVG